MIGRRSFLAGATGAALLPGILHAAGGRPQVRTTLGPLRGVYEHGLAVFRGIRYGTAQRYRAPQPPPASRQLIEANNFGPSAAQRGSRYQTSEDPLFLNVWTPDIRRGAGRPVMVYIHGG